MNISNPYLFLLLAIVFGTASNSFAKNADGFSQWVPSIASAVTIILCMYALSNVMKSLPIGITYASFAGLCIIATALVGVIKYNQSPNIYGTLGLILIISGMLLLNIFGKVK